MTKVTPKQTKPRYRVLAEKLMRDIREGKIAVGSRLPGELDLVNKHKVSRHTVRESLRVLEDLGLIERHQGLGTLVRARTSQPSYVQQVQSPSELMQYPVESYLTVIDTESVKTSRALARQLQCRSGVQWTRIDAIRRVRETDLPLCWVNIYVRPEFASVANKIGRSPKPVCELIEQEFGEQITSVEVDFTATLIAPDVCEKLDVEAGTPSLTLVRRYVGNSKRHIEISVSQHPAERYNYSLKLDRGWRSGDSWTLDH